MGMQTIVQHFAGQVERIRPLTDEESDMLYQAMRRAKSARRLWSAADDRELVKLRRKRMTADQIAERTSRTPDSVRSRMRALKRKERERV